MSETTISGKQANGEALSAKVYSAHPEASRSLSRREYLRDYQRTWMANRRREWIDANGPCAKCGSSDRLEVDHINPEEKDLHPRLIWSLSPQNPRRIAELAKCQVLCHACHKAKSRIDQRNASLKQQHHNATGYRGVTLEKCGKYRARIVVFGARVPLGFFNTAKEAADAITEYRQGASYAAAGGMNL